MSRTGTVPVFLEIFPQRRVTLGVMSTPKTASCCRNDELMVQELPGFINKDGIERQRHTKV